MRKRNSRRSGASILEFTLVGIPIIFVLISTFEISRGMWVYTTLAHATREGVRFAIVHGKNCGESPNSCLKTIADVATVVRDAGIGLEPSQLDLRFNVNCPISFNPCAASGLGTWKKLSAHLADTGTTWPPDGSNDPGLRIEIEAVYPFRSALAMFWPGAGRGRQIGLFNMPASSREAIQF